MNSALVPVTNAIQPITVWSGGAKQAFASAGKGQIRPGIPVRAALMQIAVDALVRSAMGELGHALWGPENHSGLLSRMLFLNESA